MENGSSGITIYTVYFIPFIYDSSGVEVENLDWATDFIKSLILDKLKPVEPTALQKIYKCINTHT